MAKYITKILFLVFLTVLLLFVFSACGVKNTDVCIFSDLSECNAIEQKIEKNTTVVVYDSPTGDKHLDNAIYTDFYACKYSGEYTFELNAYEFIDSDTAKSYYKRVTGRSCTQSSSYTSVAGMFNYQRTVIDDNMVYTVRTKRSDASRVTALLAEIFTTKLY